MKKIFGFLLMVLMVFVITACSDNTDELLKEAKDALTITYSSGDSDASVTKNLTLVTKGKNSATITWSSNNTDVIANDGKVTRPAFGQGDKEVKLTATLKLNDKEVTKEFTLKVKELPKSDAAKLAEAKAALAIGFATGDNKDSVKANLTLPATQGDAAVTWTTSDANIIATSGAVTRPVYGQPDATVILTANITVGAATDSKVFIVKVIAVETQSEQELVEETAGKIMLLNGTGKATSSFQLPVTGSNGSAIAWESDDETIIKVTTQAMGTGYVKALVIRPDFGAEDETVTLTATVTNGSASVEKEFVITVLAYETEPTTIASIRTTGTVETEYTIVSAVVVGLKVNDQYKGMYINDGTEYIYIHNGTTAPDVEIGDEILVTGTYTLYYGAPQLEDPSYEVLTSGNSLPTPVVKTLADFPKVPNVLHPEHMQYVRLEGVTITEDNGNYKITQGELTYDLWDQTGIEGGANIIADYVSKKVNINVVADSFHSQTLVWRFAYFGITNDIEEVQLTEQEQLDNAKSSLSLPTNVYEDLELKDKVGNVSISWDIPANTVLTEEGKVTRPADGEADVTLTLEATLTIGELPAVTKEFNITVKAINVLSIEDILTSSAKDDIVDVEGIVVGVMSQGYYLFDGTKTIYVFTSSKPTLEAEDQVRITGEYTIYNNQPEVQNLIETVELTEGQYTLPTAVDVTLDDLVDYDKEDKGLYGKYVTVQGMLYQVVGKYTDTYIADTNGNRILVYHGSAVSDLKDFVGKNITINVLLYRYSNGWQVAYMSGDTVTATDMTEQGLLDTAKNLLSLPNTINESITLQSEFNGVTITWTSNNEAIVINAETGEMTVVRPAKGDATVTLTATLKIGEITSTRTFTVTVKDTYNSVNEALVLPKGTKDVSVQGIVTAVLGNNIWLEDETGAIYIYVGGNSDYQGDLVVGNEVKITGETDNYNNLIQIKNLTDVEVINTGVAAPAVKTYNSIQELIDANPISHIVKLEGLVIIDVYPASPAANISYTVKVTDGVNIIEIRVDNKYLETDIPATLFVLGKALSITAPLSIYKTNYQFMPTLVSNITVTDTNDAQKLIYAKHVLSLEGINALTEDLTLPTTIDGVDGVTVSWVSDTPTVIANDGTITRPAIGADDAKAILTATLTIGTGEEAKTTTKEFEVTVKAQQPESDVEEEVIYETGFDAPDFTSTQSYNNTTPKLDGPEGKQWSFLSGTPAATGAINGGQSAQMRVYNSTGKLFGSITTKFTLADVTKVVFTAKNTSNINVIVSYSTDGEHWVEAETFVLTSTATEYTYNVNATGNIYLRFEQTSDGTHTDKAQLIIDDVKVYAPIAE